jgi:hypothetical protein
MTAFMRSHPEDFNELLQLAISDKQPYSWRAAWVLWSCMEQNDSRIRPHLKKIIASIPSKKDNQQRELVLALQRMELEPSIVGQVVDLCLAIWKETKKNPSLRLNALRLLISIAIKHKALSKEISHWTSPPYTAMLSDSAKKSISKLTEQLYKIPK